jgi:hypothetical protein
MWRQSGQWLRRKLAAEHASFSLAMRDPESGIRAES